MKAELRGGKIDGLKGKTNEVVREENGLRARTSSRAWVSGGATVSMRAWCTQQRGRLCGSKAQRDRSLGTSQIVWIPLLPLHPTYQI